ncbi:hypoxanthine-guanine phosphoribosyltransferase [Dechloromonas sp. XY25]|uniref:Hypoxanthine-guanine phosphoribosyltransferase n=1 Tax=Dechloromonas hankyongensis TaxID=2908002 RepID=A0ABS9K3Z6_9RHOO|nr:hypoxanthine-guanine phosphoribosyltransferase [Dechloromonas hankyongensis]MCG2577878.1 hypoxanthine-guanine phosphoribosyltransferase [Dechloromonas hankyongensis]
MDLLKARAMLDNAEVIHDESTVQRAVDEVAAAICARLADKYPLVLCVMTGGIVFCGQLMTKLGFPLDFDYLHATRYGPETQGGKISWRTAPWTSVRGRSVLVVDDILDEGVTLAAVKESLTRMGAAEVLTAVFADKINGKHKPIAADFVGLTVPDRFVFGFGMDAGGVWRNLPAVYAMKDEA